MSVKLRVYIDLRDYRSFRANCYVLASHVPLTERRLTTPLDLKWYSFDVIKPVEEHTFYIQRNKFFKRLRYLLGRKKYATENIRPNKRGR